MDAWPFLAQAPVVLRANNVRPYGDAFADGLHEEGYTIALILHSPFSIFNYQFLQKVKEKHRRRFLLCGAKA